MDGQMQAARAVASTVRVCSDAHVCSHWLELFLRHYDQLDIWQIWCPVLHLQLSHRGFGKGITWVFEVLRLSRQPD